MSETLLSVRNLRVGFGRDPKANEVVKGVSFALAAGKTPKPGPQVDRQTSCPEGGPTTLKKMAERNYDYRPQWTPTAGPVGEGTQ